MNVHTCGRVVRGSRLVARCLTLVCAIAIGMMVCAELSAQTGIELATNGDLSQGGLGWGLATTDDDDETNGVATWFLATVGDPSPINGLATSVDGRARDAYLVTDQQIQSRLAVYQQITIPAAGTYQRVRLSFDMYVNDYANVAELDPNQYVTVDVMAANADPLDLQNNIIYNVYTGTDGGPLPNPFFRHEHDITGVVVPGRSYLVRFLANVNLAVLNVGVDNFSVVATVPEPASGLLASLGGLLLLRRRGNFNMRRLRGEHVG